MPKDYYFRFLLSQLPNRSHSRHPRAFLVELADLGLANLGLANLGLPDLDLGLGLLGL